MVSNSCPINTLLVGGRPGRGHALPKWATLLLAVPGSRRGPTACQPATARGAWQAGPRRHKFLVIKVLVALPLGQPASLPGGLRRLPLGCAARMDAQQTASNEGARSAAGRLQFAQQLLEVLALPQRVEVAV